MRLLARLAKARVTTDAFDWRVGQIVCFAAAVVVFALAALKLCSMRLDEGTLIVGLLAATACSLLFVVLGLLLPISARTRRERDKNT